MQFNRGQIKDLAIGSTAVLAIYILSGILMEHLYHIAYLVSTAPMLMIRQTRNKNSHTR